MIIEFDRTFDAFQPEDWVPFITSLESLLFAHRQGWHLLVLSRKVADSIAECSGLSAAQRSIVSSNIRPRVSTLAGQARSVAKTILITHAVHSSGPFQRRQIPMNIELFAHGENLLKSRFLVEDADTDGSYLIELASLFSDVLGAFGPLELEVVHGGGTRTCSQYERACDEFRPLLWVVDSDKKHSLDGFGDIASRIVASGTSQYGRPIEALILPARSIENTVPVSTLFEVYAGNNDLRERVSCYWRYKENVSKEDALRVLSYVDLKNGLDSVGIETIPAPERALFRAAEAECVAAHGPDCGLPQISNQMMRNVLLFIRANPRNARGFSKKFRESPLYSQMQPYLRLILAYGASGGRLPIRA